MSEMVKRMAKAMVRRRICVDLYAVDNVEEFVDACWRVLEADAKAALEAMREPTEAMLEASNREWDGRMSHRSSGAWQAMIDEALR